MKIVIGNKRYSSWSLRPWLALKLAEAPFEEIVIGLDQPDTAANILRYSPSGRVPALIDNETAVWDSLAICEYLHEKFPEAQLWPKDSMSRALARSVCAEMHSGFQNLRNDCPMKILEEKPMASFRPETQGDIDRINQLWSECLARSGGPFLFGMNATIADCFFAPVVSRFRTYKIHGNEKYVTTMWNWGPLQDWIAGARAETIRARRYE
jgi:glutathione S-transferase